MHIDEESTIEYLEVPITDPFSCPTSCARTAENALFASVPTSTVDEEPVPRQVACKLPKGPLHATGGPLHSGFGWAHCYGGPRCPCSERWGEVRDLTMPTTAQVAIARGEGSNALAGIQAFADSLPQTITPARHCRA